MTAVLLFLRAWWKPIAVLAFCIALVIALGIAKHRYDEGKRDEGRAELRPKLEASIAAEKARESETAACVAASRVQSDAVQAAEAQARRALEQARRAIAEAQARARANAGLIADLQARAGAAPQQRSCTETLAAADKIARDVAKARRQ